MLTIVFLTFSETVFGVEWQKKSPNSQFITTIETTPFGLFAGENDFTPWLGRFDGVYKSTDFGETWINTGLGGRGITDIAYDNETVYAATQFAKSGSIGLFYSYNMGQTWNHFYQVNFGGQSVIAENGTILFGTISNGLWVSFDNGATWAQKIGTGFYGPKIHELKFNEKIILASTDTKTYKSLDNGNSWQEVTTLANQRVRYIEIFGDTILAGVENTQGMFRSTDLGLTWQNITNWGNYSTGAIRYFQGDFYAGKTNSQDYRSVYKSSDNGKTWQDTNLTSEGNYTNIKDLAWTYSLPSYLFAVTHNDGIYRLELQNREPKTFPFMDIPWNYSSESELTSKINSFFDHRYPLLGYKYANEPTSVNTTTMNFLGIEAGPPTQYYSSHNGIDFELPYGTLVKAPAYGYATYYYCRECGHSIKIDHLNGYETTFMHLQFDGLVSQDSVPKLVNAGDPIGKVGMTGNTSGPHLHVNVTKDLNNNGFVDDFPMGLVDPFGWQNDKFTDPWESYAWQDILGEHIGSESLYLWKVGIPTTRYVLEANGDNVITNNSKSVLFPSGAILVNAVVELYDYARPKIDETFLAGPILKYIEDSSVLIRIIDLIGNPVKETKKPVELTFDFSAMELNNVIVPSLKIYHFNIDTQEWEPLDTLLFDLENKKITGATSRFSQFALFGEVIDNETPYSTIAITGEKNQNDWYSEYPTISFATNGTVYYKVGDDIDWQKYENPIVLERIGIFAIEYKAVTENEVWEKPKESDLIRVSNGRYVGDVKVKNSVFQIPDL